MNKTALKKNVGHRVKIRPMAKRHAGGPGGLQLPPVDDTWIVQAHNQSGMNIRNAATDHVTDLGSRTLIVGIADTGGKKDHPPPLHGAGRLMETSTSAIATALEVTWAYAHDIRKCKKIP